MILKAFPFSDDLHNKYTANLGVAVPVVIMFSAIAGSFLTLLSYLVADLAYTVLDPRVTLD